MNLSPQESPDSQEDHFLGSEEDDLLDFEEFQINQVNQQVISRLQDHTVNDDLNYIRDKQNGIKEIGKDASQQQPVS